MPCACNSNNSTSKKSAPHYVRTPDGKKQAYASEIEARAAAQRINGATYIPPK
jgi:hypothetical protein